MNDTQSDTPRTDALEGKFLAELDALPKSKEALANYIERLSDELLTSGRTLERELNAANDELGKWKLGCQANAEDAKDAHRKADSYRLDNLQLRSQNAELEKRVEELSKELADLTD